MQCLYELLLIIVVLYIFGNVLENVLYKDTVENTRKRFLTKWSTISTGSLVALIGAYWLKEYCLLLPLLVALILSVAWMIYGGKPQRANAVGVLTKTSGKEEESK